MTAKQNKKFPFHFFFRFAVEGWGEETREKCKEIFWFLHTRVRERVRGALVRITTQSERTRQFQATTRSARAKSVRVLLEMGSNFFKQTPHVQQSALLGGFVVMWGWRAVCKHYCSWEIERRTQPLRAGAGESPPRYSELSELTPIPTISTGIDKSV